MLPRLANLWNAGRILFFANTNDIIHVDPAIRRSQRFDSALFVLPPGFHLKAGRLRDAGFDFELTEEEINRALIEGSDGIGWLALIRFDQVGRFVDKLAADTGGKVEGHALRTIMAETLKPFAAELRQLDWRENLSTSGNGALSIRPLIEAQRRDHGVQPVARVDVQLAGGALGPFATDGRGFATLPPDSADNPEGWVEGQGPFRLLPGGRIVQV
jgi:hypothetical protein